MLFNTNKEKGIAGFSMAIAYYGSNGYSVSIPLNDTQDYDLIIEKDSIFKRVQVKATGQRNKTGKKFVVSVKSSGGTNGSTYGRVIDSSANILFVLAEDMSMFEYDISKMTQRSAMVLEEEFQVFM